MTTGARDILEISKGVIDGTVPGDLDRIHNISPLIHELQPGLALVEAWAHVVALETDDGLVLFDTGAAFLADAIRSELRSWSDAPVHTIRVITGERLRRRFRPLGSPENRRLELSLVDDAVIAAHQIRSTEPVYDEPEFAVHNVWRQFGGWWDGNPAHLRPAPEAALASEIARLAGGADRLAQRAAQVADSGNLRLAAHLAEDAAPAAPEDSAVHDVRSEVFARLRDEARSQMARGIYAWAAGESVSQGASDD
ncbi:MAG: hypothetical protein JJLCMIEE_03129 [Acidimicrobiales bacterium]|nr:MAG: hypothetical protein EDR02_15150 [Actinomycetota bacterium]MBV6510010.1 hypothetical protein [Acidimicrobiales bacterium]RIK04300.1 MAG: hypothetical protein DCC48_13740 [Acidobacteriota bacterium]